MLVARAHAAAANWDRAADIVLKKVVSGLEFFGCSEALTDDDLAPPPRGNNVGVVDLFVGMSALFLGWRELMGMALDWRSVMDKRRRVNSVRGEE